MKNVKRFSAVLCAAAMLLSGCAEITPKTEPSAPTAPSAAAPEPGQPGTPAQIVSLSEEKTDQPGDKTAPAPEPGQPGTPAQTVGLPEEKTDQPDTATVPTVVPDPVTESARTEPVELKKTGHKGLYKVGKYSESDDVFTFSTEYDRDHVLVRHCWNEGVSDLEVYDINTSTMVGEARISADLWNIIAIEDGYYTYNDSELFIFDRYLENVKSYDLPADTDWLWLAPDKKFLIVNKYHGASKMFHLGDGELTEVDMSKSIRVNWVMGYDGYSLQATNTKNDCFRIMPTGTVFKTDSDSVSQEAPLVLDVEPDIDSVFLKYPSGNRKKLYFASGNVNEYEHDATEKYVVTLYYGEDSWQDCTIRVYDLEKGRVSEPLRIKGSVNESCISSSGKIFISSFYSPDDYGYECVSRTFILDPSELDYPNDADIISVSADAPDYMLYFKKPEGETDRTNELLKELHDRFNVDVFFDTADPNNRLAEYVCRPYTGSREEALEALRDFLALSPDELVSQVTHGKGLYVMFSDDIEDPPAPRLGVAGFQGDSMGHAYIVAELYHDAFNIPDEENGGEKTIENVSSEAMVYLFSHEFMHFLDDGLYEKYEDFNSDWEKLSPENSYLYNYDSSDDYDEESRYTMYDYSDYDYSDDYYSGINYNAYFTDSYGRRNHDEDRAEIGQYLYQGYMGFYAPFDEYPNLTAKAEKLIGMLRETYPCLSKIPAGEWYLELAMNKEWCEEKARQRREEYEAQFEAERQNELY